VSTSPTQTASYFRSGVENNFTVLFHFIIHFITTIGLHFEKVAADITSLNKVHEVLGSRLCLGTTVLNQDYDVLRFAVV
jgi:hypothetical protein